MPVLKGATKRLQKAGIEHLQVKKGLWGYYLFDTRLKKQKDTCRQTWQAAVKDALGGARPCLVVGQMVKIYFEGGDQAYITISAEVGLDDLLQAVADDYGRVVIGFVLMGVVCIQEIDDLLAESPDGTRFIDTVAEDAPAIKK